MKITSIFKISNFLIEFKNEIIKTILIECIEKNDIHEVKNQLLSLFTIFHNIK